MRTLKHLWVPAGAFLLAVLLSIVAAPSYRAFARQAADATGSDCQSHIRNIRGRAKAKNLRISPLLPSASTGKVRTRTVLDVYSGIIQSGAGVKSETVVSFGSEMRVVVGNSEGFHGLELSLPALGDAVERFERTGLGWKRNLEAQFHEDGRDLARLLRAALQDLEQQGQFYSFDPASSLYTFRQLSSSDTYRAPVDGARPACASDVHVLPLVLQTTGGDGVTTGFQFE